MVLIPQNKQNITFLHKMFLLCNLCDQTVLNTCKLELYYETKKYKRKKMDFKFIRYTFGH